MIADMLGSQIVQVVALGAAMLGALGGMLGAFAVLRRQSLLGDAIAHAALPGICLGFLLAGGRDLAAMLGGALATGLLAAAVMLAITRTTRLKTDAALGIVLSVFFAIGVMLLSVAQARGGGSAGLSGFLFGQAAAILRTDLWLIAGAGLVALGLVLALWKELKLVSFDPDFARAQGYPALWLEGALTLLMALAIVAGLQLAGVVLMVALLVAPAVAARQWTGSLGVMVSLSAAFGALSGLVGALVSAQARGLATGPVVVLVATGIVALSLLLAPERGLMAQAMARRRARATISDRALLRTLQGLATAHADANYPTEEAMLAPALGARPSPTQLAALERRGLIRATAHPPETTPHWELTEAGHKAAEWGKPK